MRNSHLEFFQDFPSNSTLWVYNSSKLLSDKQLSLLELKLRDFVRSWKSHGIPLKGDYVLYKNQFIVLIVHPDSMASGCSIDGSVHLLQSLEIEFQTEFLNNALVPIQIDNHPIVNYPFLEAKKVVKTGIFHSNTRVYNLAVRTLEEFRSSFEMLLSDSFLKSSLPN